MMAILKMLAGPKLGKWLTGLAAPVGGALALLIARRRGLAVGRAEMRAKNAQTRARKRVELGEVRKQQLEAANKRPETSELDKILDEGRF